MSVGNGSRRSTSEVLKDGIAGEVLRDDALNRARRRRRANEAEDCIEPPVQPSRLMATAAAMGSMETSRARFANARQRRAAWPSETRETSVRSSDSSVRSSDSSTMASSAFVDGTYGSSDDGASAMDHSAGCHLINASGATKGATSGASYGRSGRAASQYHARSSRKTAVARTPLRPRLSFGILGGRRCAVWSSHDAEFDFPKHGVTLSAPRA